MTKFPLWTALQSPAGGAVPTVLVLLVLSGCWVRLVASLWNEEDDAGPSRKAAVLAGLWFFCAYLPNYFWHISPRHNYLPSLGFLMLLALAGKTLSESRPRLRAALSCGAFALFGLSASAAVSEGYGWTKSAELLARFRAEAPLLLPARPQAIFLMDAPTSVYRAPAFDQPGEHQTLFADATGHLPGDGDLTFTPTRTGAFFRNQPALHGGDLRWLPYGAMSVVAFRQDGGFRCASRLRLSLPDGGISEMPLSASPGCREPFGMEVRVWLVSSRSLPRSSRRPLFTAANGASLVGLSAERQAAFLEVELVWQAPQGAVKDFASFIRLYDHAGKLVFEPAYPVLSAGQRRPDALWPVSNDLHPASRWKKDAVVSERYQLACAGPLPGGPLMAELTLLEKSESGPWRKVGVYRAAL